MNKVKWFSNVCRSQDRQYGITQQLLLIFCSKLELTTTKPLSYQTRITLNVVYSSLLVAQVGFYRKDNILSHITTIILYYRTLTHKTRQTSNPEEADCFHYGSDFGRLGSGGNTVIPEVSESRRAKFNVLCRSAVPKSPTITVSSSAIFVSFSWTSFVVMKHRWRWNRKPSRTEF